MNAPERLVRVATVADGISDHPDALALLRAAVGALRDVCTEIRGLRADMRRGERLVALRDAIEDEFGDGAFTVSGLLEAARLDPDTDLARVLADLLDMKAPERNRATQLGRLLGTLPWLAAEGEKRGSALYYLTDAEVRGSPPHGRG